MSSKIPINHHENHMIGSFSMGHGMTHPPPRRVSRLARRPSAHRRRRNCSQLRPRDASDTRGGVKHAVEHGTTEDFSWRCRCINNTQKRRRMRAKSTRASFSLSTCPYQIILRGAPRLLDKQCSAIKAGTYDRANRIDTQRAKTKTYVNKSWSSVSKNIHHSNIILSEHMNM